MVHPIQWVVFMTSIKQFLLWQPITFFLCHSAGPAMRPSQRLFGDFASERFHNTLFAACRKTIYNADYLRNFIFTQPYMCLCILYGTLHILPHPLQQIHDRQSAMSSGQLSHPSWAQNLATSSVLSSCHFLWQGHQGDNREPPLHFFGPSCLRAGSQGTCCWENIKKSVFECFA